MKPIEDLTADYLQELDGQLHDADVLALPEGCERCSHCESGGSSDRQLPSQLRRQLPSCDLSPPAGHERPSVAPRRFGHVRA